MDRHLHFLLDHRQGRAMLSLTSRRATSSRGFTTVELLVGLVSVGVLMSISLPTLSDWIRNARLRATAEALTSGLYHARNEAARRNAIVRFQLVTTQDAGCALSASGQHWIVNLAYDNSGGAASPAGACGSAISDSTTPFILRSSPTISNTANAPTLTGNRSLMGFDGLGRLNALGTATTTATFTVDVAGSTGTCVAAGGTVRCLRVVVLPGGLISMCDPSRTITTDPMYCPS
jgi:type IV fimbrial biogenesis protein FimT